MLQHIRSWFLKSSLFIAIALSVSIAIISLISATNLPNHSFNISDKLLHAFAYFALIWGWLLVFRNRQNIKSKLLIFICLILFGIILELLQGSMMLHRSADWKDVVANAFGLLAGLVTFKYMYQVVFNTKTVKIK